MKHIESKQLTLFELIDPRAAAADSTAMAGAAEKPPANGRLIWKTNQQPVQASLASLALDPGWASRRPPRRPVVSPELTHRVRQQARSFQNHAIATGVLSRESANTKRKALECIAKQAGRLLDRPLDDLAELYDIETMAGVALDDQPFDQEVAQLGRSTLRQRRGLLAQYLSVIGVPGLTFEQGMRLIKEGFREAAKRRRYRYVLGVGRPEQHDGYMPPLDDVMRFFQATEHYGRWFSGRRLAAAAALSLHHGLRPVSVLAILGADFRWKGEHLFPEIKEKRSKDKRERREIEIRGRVIPILQRYVAAVNRNAARLGWRQRVEIGSGDLFFLDQRGGDLHYGTLLRDFGACCSLTRVEHFTAYGLRRLYASGLASLLPMGDAARAGGWLNEGVFGRHYARSLAAWQPHLRLSGPPTSLDDDLPPGMKADRLAEVATDDVRAV